MKNHGVMVVGDSIGQAYDLLYYLERCCMFQVLALSTGQKLNDMEKRNIEQVKKMAAYEEQVTIDGSYNYGEAHFESIKRVLDEISPGYKE